MELNKVVQALKVLQDEGREDLIREGVLEQAWVGLRRPKRLLAEGVTAAITACTSPERAPKKFKTKSIMGRKVARLLEQLSEILGAEAVNLPAARLHRRGGGRFRGIPAPHFISAWPWEGGGRLLGCGECGQPHGGAGRWSARTAKSAHV
ncbi:hypothetical protein NDU88_005381 [Pleurodeles waltl]|uniref:Uncharacterized protein n=1 Tax=Pleurodeles waltl TaxID=8319 RepID=A0AAV7MXB7_PLEWA|nr:hypothetical protein NDU88_005381 [Pleurodeles waltl]